MKTEEEGLDNRIELQEGKANMCLYAIHQHRYFLNYKSALD